MLKRFEVSGFKQFGHLVWDFSRTREYAFNQKCVKDGLVRDGLIYGANASGKTNLGLALFDITAHLSDKNSAEDLYRYYLKADADVKYADFRYDFQFPGHHFISYSYRKSSHRLLLGEELTIDGRLVLRWPDAGGIFIDPEFQEMYKFGDMKWDFQSSDLSAVKYVFNNMLSDSSSLLSQFRTFVNGMLWFQRNDLNNRYIGYLNTHEDIYDYIVREGYIGDFEKFLHELGEIAVKLAAIQNPDGNSELYFDYGQKIPFSKAASSGTRALSLFYYWLKHKKGITFLFIDEFDAFYHFKLAKKVFQYLISDFAGQAMVTSHNIDLLTNRITRPDCCFVVRNGQIASFADSTSREIRQGNNLERLYVGGEFDE